MRIRLRQVAFVAADLAATERDIEADLGVELCFRDEGVGNYGLHNALYPIGDNLLEVVSPLEGGTTAGRLLDKRGGDGGYMVLLQIDDLAGMRQRLAELGVRIVSDVEGTADRLGSAIHGVHLHPKDIGGAIVSVDETESWDEWGWAGPTWREHVRTDVVTDLVAVRVQASDPPVMAARWGEVLDRPVTSGEQPRIDLDEGAIIFEPATDGRGDGVSGIDVRAADGKPRESEICGVRVRFGT